MSSFYTNVIQRGNQLLVRSIVNGMPQKQKVDFQPTLYTTNKKTTSVSTEWKTLEGIPSYEIHPGDINDCKEFIKSHDGISGFNIFGQTNYANQYIATTYPNDIEFDSSQLKIVTVDIEILVSESGKFPKPKQADEEIVLISIMDKNSKQVVTFGTKKYTGELCSGYIQCVDEKDLLNKFLLHWQYSYPDIITGWNTGGFDIPYIVNRMKKIIGDSYKKLSPWGIVQEKNIMVNGSEEQTYNILGVSSLDYLPLYKKYTYKTRESYKLQNIAFDELGETKLDHSQGNTFREYCTGVYDVFELDENPSEIQKMGFRRTELKNSTDVVLISEYQELDVYLRQTAWNLYCEYVEQDVMLVDKLDDKLKLIELHLTMAYTSKLNYIDAIKPVKLWNNIIYNDLHKKKIVIPNPRHSQKGEQFEGAYVKSPIKGMHKWIASFDLASLYPHLIWGSNISPETISTTKLNVSVDSLLRKEPLPSTGLSVTANGWCYKKDHQGFLPELMKVMYESRSTDKKQMLKCESELELIKSDPEQIGRKKFLIKEISRLDNLQMGKKIALNSAYGALGNQYFNYYDLRLAESITLTGQLAIRWIANKLNAYMNQALKTIDIDYVIASDTDSVIGSTQIIVDGNPISIEDFYESLPNDFIKRDEFNEDWVKKAQGITATVSKDSILEYNDIKYVMKHKVKKRMYSIKSNGKEVIVTEDHSVIVKDKISGEIKSIKPKELNSKIHFIINITDTDKLI